MKCNSLRLVWPPTNSPKSVGMDERDAVTKLVGPAINNNNNNNSNNNTDFNYLMFQLMG